MARYRIVQAKPDGFDSAFVIEAWQITPAIKKINNRYLYQLSWWETQCKYNAAARPADWFVEEIERQEWKEIGAWYSASTLKEAEKIISKLILADNLQEELKTFKRKIIKEYD